MFKTILYPTDFSEVTNKALDFIRQLKESSAEQVIVLHIIDQPAMSTMTYYQAEIAHENLMI